ncbi:MAG TPA: hypothetical protein VF550_05445 [Polyangia bacterium]
MKGLAKHWITNLVVLVLAIVMCRFLLGYWFGGTEDQCAHVRLWNAVQEHQNLYAQTPRVQVWPPLWWILVGLWGSLWRGFATIAPGWVGAVGTTYALKLLYYTFEMALAFLLALHLARDGAQGLSTRSGDVLKYAGYFLLLPATWVLTSLHGNFDPIPAFFVIAAFLLLEFKTSETSALLAAFCVGLGAMARTFPGIFIFPVLVFILRRHGWRTALFASVLAFVPTFVSLYPIYLMTPDAVAAAIGYRGTPGAWWGLAAVARITISNSLGIAIFHGTYPVFYLAMLALLAGTVVGFWQRKVRIMNAGLLLAIGLFTFAPTLGNQNFYFLLPWAFWFAVKFQQRAAKFFLLFVSVNFVLAYIVLPIDLEHPVWFQWTYDCAGGHVARMASPKILVRFLVWFTAIFKLKELGYGHFIQLVMRVPVWGVMIWWFVSSLREVIAKWKGNQQLRQRLRAPCVSSAGTRATNSQPVPPR